MSYTRKLLLYIHAVLRKLAGNVVRAGDKEVVVGSRAPDFKRVADDRFLYVYEQKSQLEPLHIVIICLQKPA